MAIYVHHDYMPDGRTKLQHRMNEQNTYCKGCATCIPWILWLHTLKHETNAEYKRRQKRNGVPGPQKTTKHTMRHKHGLYKTAGEPQGVPTNTIRYWWFKLVYWLFWLQYVCSRLLYRFLGCCICFCGYCISCLRCCSDFLSCCIDFLGGCNLVFSCSIGCVAGRLT